MNKPSIKKITLLLCIFLSGNCFVQLAAQTNQAHKDLVKETSGLVAFWDFEHKNDALDKYTAHSSLPESGTDVSNNTLYPINLKKYDDATDYTISNWAIQNPGTPLHEDITGPFGQAIKLDAGRLFALVPRTLFADKPLGQLYDKQPFSLVAWVKFHGSNNHHIAGIWDEGLEGNGIEKKYSGQRQFALFTINRYRHKLFGHFSATGAASYPQSTLSGNQYAKLRAINGSLLDHVNEEDPSNVSDTWYQLAMTYDGTAVKSYVNGTLSNFSYIDHSDSQNSAPIIVEIYGNSPEVLQTNPNPLDHGIYGPRKFILKFDGNYHNSSQVKEHYIAVDLLSANKSFTYKRIGTSTQNFYIEYAIKRGNTLLTSGNFIATSAEQKEDLPTNLAVVEGDIIELRLKENNSSGNQIGSLVRREIKDGAPFSFGRILGGLENGAQIHMDGAAVFNRALTIQELLTLTFDPSLAITDNNKDNTPIISVYPNPVKDKLIIHLNTDSITSDSDSIISLYDLNGKLINHIENKSNQATIQYNVKNMKSGAYIIRVKQNGHIINKMFIKE